MNLLVVSNKIKIRNLQQLSYLFESIFFAGDFELKSLKIKMFR